ncbi:MAG: hypothetical protein A2138_08585 [Deltaproteobacteria bacterium RBG_16_71_12]|nr:MAG: hypothetical protein A2138_08585 [Deltaproteobacteria bacterium RBG_16_71_12]
MTERIFLDTNVLVYADDADARDKRVRAQQRLTAVLTAGAAVVSTQVLQEYYVIATRKLRLPPDVARLRVETLARLDVVVIRPEHVLAAIDLQRLRSLSFWDALVVRAAVAGGCSRLLTEDMNHGEVIEGVRIEDPFRA